MTHDKTWTRFYVYRDYRDWVCVSRLLQDLVGHQQHPCTCSVCYHNCEHVYWWDVLWLCEMTCTWTCLSASGLIDSALSGEPDGWGWGRRHERDTEVEEKKLSIDLVAAAPDSCTKPARTPLSLSLQLGWHGSAWADLVLIPQISCSPVECLCTPTTPSLHRQTHCLCSTIKSLLMYLNADMRAWMKSISYF